MFNNLEMLDFCAESCGNMTIRLSVDGLFPQTNTRTQHSRHVSANKSKPKATLTPARPLLIDFRKTLTKVFRDPERK